MGSLGDPTAAISSLRSAVTATAEILVLESRAIA